VAARRYSDSVSLYIAGIYALMSLITFVACALDKRAARLGRPRTSEATLHALELLGGWPGALLAQRLIRHKNAKVGYQVVYWLIGAVHVAGWIAVAAIRCSLSGLPIPAWCSTCRGRQSTHI
jgi:uncharacterized membrane protein YsdA (DUF1294 family)